MNLMAAREPSRRQAWTRRYRRPLPDPRLLLIAAMPLLASAGFAWRSLAGGDQVAAGVGALVGTLVCVLLLGLYARRPSRRGVGAPIRRSRGHRDDLSA